MIKIKNKTNDKLIFITYMGEIIMDKKKIIKYSVVSLTVICVLIGSSFIGLKSVRNIKSFLFSVNNNLASMSNDIKSLEKITQNSTDKDNNSDYVINDSISDLKVKFIFGDELYLNTEKDGVVYELNSLNSDQVIKVYLRQNGNLEIELNDNEITTNKWNEVKIDKIKYG